MKTAQEKPEAWEWLKPEKWEGEIREMASRRFFQVWNGIKGREMGAEKSKTYPHIRPNIPLRCSIWRSRVRRYDAILQNLILGAPENLLATFEQGLLEIYDELEQMAQTGDARAVQLYGQVQYIVGKGTYEAGGLREQVEQRYEEERGQERGRRRSPAGPTIDYFYKLLKNFPVLQKKYLDRVVDDTWTDFQERGGYDKGQSMAGGQMTTNRLLTFYLMESSYPYLQSYPPTTNVEEVMRQYPQGNTPETALEGEAPPGAKQTFDEINVLNINGTELYVKNERNPKYNFVTITPREAGAPEAATKKVRQKVVELQRQSIFNPNIYLAKNVLKDSPSFEEYPGVSLLYLGREGDFPIADHERDITKLENGGLFWVPEGGLPKEETYYPALEKRPTQPQRPTTPKSPEVPRWEFRQSTLLPPSKNLFAQSLYEVFGQQTTMPDIWIDDQGKAYDSMEELVEEYARQSWDQFWNTQAKDVIRSVVEQYLTRMPGQVVQMPTFEPEVQEVQPLEPYHVEEEMPVEEEELALAARHVIRLVRVAKQLDDKGFLKEADKVDDITRDIIVYFTHKSLIKL